MITARFPVSHCETCDRDVALYNDVEGDALIKRCLHCDSILVGPADSKPEAPKLRLVRDGEMRQLGYLFEGDDPEEEFEGCGKPNCGKGNCKTSGKKHPFAEQS